MDDCGPGRGLTRAGTAKGTSPLIPDDLRLFSFYFLTSEGYGGNVILWDFLPMGFWGPSHLERPMLCHGYLACLLRMSNSQAWTEEGYDAGLGSVRRESLAWRLLVGLGSAEDEEDETSTLRRDERRGFCPPPPSVLLVPCIYTCVQAWTTVFAEDRLHPPDMGDAAKRSVEALVFDSASNGLYEAVYAHDHAGGANASPVAGQFPGVGPAGGRDEASRGGGSSDAGPSLMGLAPDGEVRAARAQLGQTSPGERKRRGGWLRRPVGKGVLVKLGLALWPLRSSWFSKSENPRKDTPADGDGRHKTPPSGGCPTLCQTFSMLSGWGFKRAFRGADARAPYSRLSIAASERSMREEVALESMAPAPIGERDAGEQRRKGSEREAWESYAEDLQQHASPHPVSTPNNRVQTCCSPPGQRGRMTSLAAARRQPQPQTFPQCPMPNARPFGISPFAFFAFHGGHGATSENVLRLLKMKGKMPRMTHSEAMSEGLMAEKKPKASQGDREEEGTGRKRFFSSH
ncbi:hypothetical protein HRG_014823 [Hirsutella rhossiliensis]